MVGWRGAGCSVVWGFGKLELRSITWRRVWVCAVRQWASCSVACGKLSVVEQSTFFSQAVCSRSEADDICSRNQFWPNHFVASTQCSHQHPRRSHHHRVTNTSVAVRVSVFTIATIINRHRRHQKIGDVTAISTNVNI